MVNKIDYGNVIDAAMRSIVKRCLRIVQENNEELPGNHHFYITFDTTNKGVEISEGLRAKYPQKMTIVLQHQFWDLEIKDKFFKISLNFNNVAETLKIPYDSLMSFTDPSCDFAIQFDSLSEDEDFIEDIDVEFDGEMENKLESSPAKKRKKSDEDSSGNVISIDSFRKD